ncbi:MAG: hypothetical protein II453_04715 [Alphaproteobacteria bacterium]|nr:hypothetical protein [Alphaproteobacteria bacterium]
MDIVELLETFLEYDSERQYELLSGIGRYNAYWNGEDYDWLLDGLDWSKVQTALEKNKQRKNNRKYKSYNRELWKRIHTYMIKKNIEIPYIYIDERKGLKTVFDSASGKWIAESEEYFFCGGGRRPRRVSRKK